MPADRLTEGLMIDLNVRENAALTALDRLKSGPFVSRRREVEVVERELSELAVKAPSLEAPVSALSGGNQQKVVMARAMLSKPAHPRRRRADPGRRRRRARRDLPHPARGRAPAACPSSLASSDALELEGLCDRVIVMSRGHAVATLEGDAVTEERIIHAAISATTHTAEQATRAQSGWSTVLALHRGRLRPGRHPRSGDRSRSARMSCTQNSRYLSDFNITSVMFACAALGFISLGQTFALLLGGIDLSVGPLAGFLVVVGVVLRARRQVDRRSGCSASA